MSDYLASLGAVGFTYRLRRLADRMQDAARRLYEALDVPLEPSWHALLLYLDAQGSASVTEAAGALRVSHPAISELARRMEQAGLIEVAPDPGDGRRRVLTLSTEGRRQLPDFKILWSAAGEELESVIEGTTGSDALAALAIIEAQLDAEELDSRIQSRLASANTASLRPSGATAGSNRQVSAVSIRPATAEDRDAVLHIARELVRVADTYAYDPSISDDQLWSYWCPAVSGGPGDGFVASLEGQVVGMFVIRPNIPGPGAHVANASYAVRADMRGIGLGRQMGEASLGLAVELGYRAMQFNTVVATNVNAVRLWRSLGFRIVGTIPDGFRLPDGTEVPHHIMYRALP